jgi:hypothetical protein
MMVTAGGKKCRLLPVTLRQLKAKHIAIKTNRPLQISHLQMHVANADLRMYWTRAG